jgi:hypothetical protein
LKLVVELQVAVELGGVEDDEEAKQVYKVR